MTAPDLLLGVAVLLWRDGRLLMNPRAGAHGAGTWSIPGGHVDPGEWPDETARRELLEETGVEVSCVVPVSFTWSDFPEVGRRYVTLFFAAAAPPDALPAMREPEKASAMDWVSAPELPQPLFEPLAALIEQEPGVLLRASEMACPRFWRQR
jgi:8-oxo-dGTP diphosphatase